MMYAHQLNVCTESVETRSTTTNACAKSVGWEKSVGNEISVRTQAAPMQHYVKIRIADTFVLDQLRFHRRQPYDTTFFFPKDLGSHPRKIISHLKSDQDP